MSDEWVAETTKRIGDEIRRLRGDRSGQWLSDQTAELGHRVSRSTISEIETYRRKTITVTDLIVLAVALNTAPVALVYPGPYGYDSKVEMLPGVEVAEIDAAQIFSGNRDIAADSPDALVPNSDEFAKNVRSLWHAQSILGFEGLYKSMAGSVAEMDPDSSLAKGLQKQLDQMRVKIEEMRAGDGG